MPINMLAGYYFDSEPLDIMAINFPVYTYQTDQVSGLGPRGITWWADALNMAG